MTDAAIAAEIIEITDELLSIGQNPSKPPSHWERFEWTAGFGLNVAGLVAGGPITPIGLGLFGVGSALLVVSIARRMASQTGDYTHIARIDALKQRLYVLRRELSQRQ